MWSLKENEFWKNVNFEKKCEFWKKMWILKKFEFEKLWILKIVNFFYWEFLVWFSTIVIYVTKSGFSSSMVIRDLTLRSAASFGSFHLIRLLYDEYVFYLVEQKVAQVLHKSPVAVMGLQQFRTSKSLTLREKLEIITISNIVQFSKEIDLMITKFWANMCTKPTFIFRILRPK